MSNVSQSRIDPTSGHPADVAIERERTGGAPGSTLTPEELAHYSQMSPGDLVAGLANSHEPVPRNSPLHRMSSDQLKNEMDKSMRAIQDFRSVQQSIGTMNGKRALAEQDPTNENMRSMLGTPMFDSQGNVRIEGSEFQKAEDAVEKSRYSATLAGFRDAEYNQAVQQLESTNPNAPQPSADFASITENADGTLRVKLRTGETFAGDARKIIDAMSKSYVYGKEWTRGIKAENAQLKNAQALPQSSQPQPAEQPTEFPPPQAQPNLGQMPDESTMWLLNNIAKTAGFPDANAYLSYQQQRDQRLQELESKFETFDSRMVAEDFVAAHPEFPGSEAAADVLDGLMTRSGLAPTAENLALMHVYAMQAGMYQPLRPDEIEASYSPQSQQTSGRRPVPPVPPGGNNPDNYQDVGNPWAMATDQLKKRVLEGGGLGKVLLDLRAGETLGG